MGIRDVKDHVLAILGGVVIVLAALFVLFQAVRGGETTLWPLDPKTTVATWEVVALSAVGGMLLFTLGRAMARSILAIRARRVEQRRLCKKYERDAARAKPKDPAEREESPECGATDGNSSSGRGQG